MKKWILIILIVCIIPFCIGIYSRFSHIETTNVITSNFDNYPITYVLSKDILQNSVINSNQEVDQQTGNTVKENINLQKANESSNTENEGSSFFEYLDSTLEESEYIIIVEATGKSENLFRTLKQEMKVISVCKGNRNIIGKTIDLVDCGTGFFDKFNCFNGSFVNIMQKNNLYMVFMNTIKDKNANNLNLYTSSDIMGFPYFNLKNKNNIIPKKSEAGIIYGEVKNNEFFVADKYSLQELQSFKMYIFDKYKIEITY
jgi:hypothetical protein